MAKRRTEITIEGHEIIAIKHGGRRIIARCPECCREVPMVRVDEAALLAGSSGREICRQLEAGSLHGTTEGPLLICVASLADSNREPMPR